MKKSQLQNGSKIFWMSVLLLIPGTLLAQHGPAQSNSEFFKAFEDYERALPAVDNRSEQQKLESRALHAENRRRELFEAKSGDASEHLREGFEQRRPSFQWVKEHAGEYLSDLHKAQDALDESQTADSADETTASRTPKSRRASGKTCGKDDCSNPLEYLKANPIDPNELVSEKGTTARKVRSARTSARRTKPVRRQDGAGSSEGSGSSVPTGVSSTR